MAAKAHDVYFGHGGRQISEKLRAEQEGGRGTQSWLSLVDKSSELTLGFEKARSPDNQNDSRCYLQAIRFSGHWPDRHDFKLISYPYFGLCASAFITTF